MRAYGIRATRMSTRSPRNGTPSASSSARWRAPLASEPSARTIRHHGHVVGRRAGEHRAGEARRARRDVAVGAHEALRRVADPRAARACSVLSCPRDAPRHVFDRRARSGDRRARRRRCSRTGSPSARCARGRAPGSARWRRSRSSSPPTARTRSTGSPTASARSRRSASCSPPTRWPRVRQVAVVDARGGVGVAHRRGLHRARRPRDRRALELPGQHDGPRHRAGRRCRPRSTRADGDLAERLLAALDAAEGEGGDVRGRQSAALVVVPAEGEPWRRTRRPARRGPRRPARRAAPAARRSSAPTSSPGAADELLAAGRADEAGELYRARGRARARAPTSCCSGPASRSPRPATLDGGRRRGPAGGRGATRTGWCCSTGSRRSSRPRGAPARAAASADHLQVERRVRRRAASTRRRVDLRVACRPAATPERAAAGGAGRRGGERALADVAC